MATTSAKKESLSFREIMDKSAKSAFRGGISGATAMFCNVGCLMWMRTTVRYNMPMGRLVIYLLAYYSSSG